MAQDGTLVGRDEELALIARRLDDPASAGVLLFGPAGVGKTRLARAATSQAAASGRTVIAATATRSSADLAFGVLVDLLPPPGTEPSRLEVIQHALATVRDAGRDAGRAVIAVDDVHLADDATAALLLRIAEGGLASLVLTVRAGEPVPDAVTALWKDDFVTRVDLQPIAPAEAAALAGSLVGGTLDEAAARRIWDITGGNPLYVREVVRAARASGALAPAGDRWSWRGGLVPDGQLVDAVAVHLEGVDADVLDVMHLVSVGESLPRPLVVHLVGADALRAAEEAELVVVDPSGDRVRPAHPLFGEVVRASMASSAVHAARERLATALLDLAVDLDLGVLPRALWFLSLPPGAAAGPSAAARVRDTVRDGATAANRLGDYALAERLAVHALEHGAGPQATLALAISHATRGDHDAAERVLLDALADPPADRWRGAMANIHVAVRVWDRGDLDGAFDVLDRWSAGVTDPEAVAALDAERANLLLHRGRAAEAYEIASEIVEDVDGFHVARCRAFEPLALAAVVLGRTDRCAELAPGLALRSMGLRHLNSLAPIWVATGYFTVLVARGALDEATRLIDLVESAAPVQDEQVQALLLGSRGFVATRAGRVREGYEQLARSVAMTEPGRPGLALIIDLGALANAASMAGEPDAARRAIERAAAAVPGGMAFADVMVDRVRAHVAFAAGDLEGARAGSRAAASACEALGWGGLEALCLFDALRYGARGDVLDRLIALGPRLEGPALAATVELATGLRSGDGALADAAAAAFAQLGCLLDAAEAGTFAADLHRRAGRQDLAGAARARAEDWFARCEGARSPVVLGLGRGTAGVDLTRREREVALAAAGGRSNREIAEALSVSVRTVEGHLLRAYGKLGVSDRAGLARVLGGDRP